MLCKIVEIKISGKTQFENLLKHYFIHPCWIWSDYNQLALRAHWLFYHFISNSGSWNNCYIMFCFKAAKTVAFKNFDFINLWPVCEKELFSMESMATKPLYETSFNHQSSTVLHLTCIITFRFNKARSLFKRSAKESLADMTRWIFSILL